MKRWLMLSVMCLFLAGCKVIPAVTDPVTGETTPKQYQVDPNTAAVAETAAEVLVAGGTVASTFLPWLTPIIGIAAGALATWKKVKPQLTTATSERDAYYTGGSVLAQALEEVKTTMPDVWEKVGPVIEKANGPVGRAEDAIRGFRGLPPR